MSRRSRPLTLAAACIVACTLFASMAQGESLYSGMELLVDKAKALTIETLPVTRRAADGGDAEAQAVLGFAYTMGSAGLPLDHKSAAREFERAARSGNAFAQLMLATMHLQGAGVARDRPLAISWLRKAAEQRNPEAAYMLGAELMIDAHAANADFVEAHKWFKVAMGVTTDEGKRIGFARHADIVAERMTAAQIAASEKQAAEWLASHSPSRQE
jgi:hypothetical protein